MKYQSYPTKYQTSYHVSPSVPHSALFMGGLGAVVGAGNAAAQSNRQIQNNEIDRRQAVEHVINESIGTGLAVATATAVVGAVGARGVVSLVGILALSAGAKYLWDTATSPEPEAASKETKSAPSSVKTKTKPTTKKK